MHLLRPELLCETRPMQDSKKDPSVATCKRFDEQNKLEIRSPASTSLFCLTTHLPACLLQQRAGSKSYFINSLLLLAR
jgi:hypothetical protein